MYQTAVAAGSPVNTAPRSNDAAQAQQTMRRLVTGAWLSQAIVVAAELSLADRLVEKEQSVDELAAACGAQPDALYRLLQTLGCAGLFHESEGRRFRNTPLSETLRSDIPGSLRSLVRQMGIDPIWRAWGHMLYSVKTGRSAFHHLTGQTLFEYIGEHPDAAEIVDSAMVNLSEQEAPALVSAYDFSNAGLIVDVGGGRGQLLAEILAAAPSARGILQELPHAAESARHLFAARGLAARAEVVTSDALEAVVPGADLYIMKHIVHDWDDAHAQRFLSNCAAAMRPDSKLLLAEMILAPPNEPHFSKLLDLHMLVNYPGGRERTLDDFHRLHRSAGLRPTRVLPTESLLSLIESVRR